MMDYQNALSGLAAGMAGQSGEDQGETENEFVPCPLCGGAGIVSEQQLTGGGMGAMPPRLAARAPMIPPMGGGGAPMPMMPRPGMGA